MPSFKLAYALLCFLLISLSSSSRAEFDFDTSVLSKQEKNWLKEHKTITVGFDANFPPYSYLNDDGELEGFSLDIFRLIAQHLSVKMEPRAGMTWEALYTSAQEKKVDLVATMVNKPERAQWFNFTSPYIFKSLVIMTQAEEQDINHRTDLENKTVALVKAYQYSDRIVEEFPTIKPLFVDDMLDALNMVSTGKADAAITFSGAGHYYRTKYLISNLKFSAIYDKRSAAESIAVREDWPELASIIDKVLDAVPESTLQRLRAKWLPSEYLDNLAEIKLTPEELKWIEQHQEIKLGVDPEFAPFEYIENGQYLGMASDYVKLLNKRLNLNMSVEPDLTWERVVQKAELGKIDVLPAVGKTQSRQKYLNYTEPYLNFHRVIITQSDFPFIASLDDLNNSRVGVQASSSHQGYIEENSMIRPVTFDTLEASLLAVSGGKVDAFVGNVAASTYWIRKLNLTNLKVAAPVSREVQSLHFAIRKDWPELVTILQKGLDSISEKEKKKIANRWLQFEYKPSVDYTLVWFVAGVFSVALLSILLWNIILKRAINKHSSELVRNAHYDQLTGLPNRFLVLDRLSQYTQEASRQNTSVAMLSINLDDFKRINDTFSHETGDKLLRSVSDRLSSLLGPEETLGRLSGDQYLMIITHMRRSTDAAVKAQTILNCFEEPFNVDKHALSLSARIGIAIFPDDGETPKELLKNADIATHHTKELGKGTFSFYTEKLNAFTSRRLQLEQNIRNALDNNEFYVVYQPKLDVASKKIVSFEALLRWNSPQLGEVSPAEFIPVTEENGQIEALGEFVLQQALEAVAKWQEECNENYTMAVNLSPRQFRSNNLVSFVKETINRTELSATTLELEITEGILMSSDPAVETMLKQITDLGINLSLDDFGTGYASMSYLRKYDFDLLKIDREFINDLTTDKNSLPLVSAMIAMAHSLNMKVVAEGVETPEQFGILEKLNCDLVQGWLFGRPELPDVISERLREQ